MVEQQADSCAGCETWKRVSESWRRAHFSWQDWALEMLAMVGLQIPWGEMGDEQAREAIGNALKTAIKAYSKSEDQNAKRE